MRTLAFSLMTCLALTLGCAEPSTESPASVTGTSGEGSTEKSHDHGEGGHDHGAEGHSDEAHGETDEHAEDEHAAHGEGSAVRFVADRKIEVPDMMCPYSCWPNVKKTLEGQPGVAGVQLAEQPEGTPEGEITNRVVELKIDGEFDLASAVAAVKDVGFDSQELK